MTYSRALAGVPLIILAAGCGAQSDSPGWLVTTYYTAVESLHNGPPETVIGCTQLDCRTGNSDLGHFPADFVLAVHEEGTGRITNGSHAGMYLNWSTDTGYWLDTAARDAYGHPLQRLRSAAADGLAKGTMVQLINCGHVDNGELPASEVCATLGAPTWVISDAFTPGSGGDHHIDLYLGEETPPGIRDNPLYTTLHNAVLRLRT